MSWKPLAALLLLALASCGREPRRVPVDHAADQAAAPAQQQPAHAGHGSLGMADVVVEDDRRQLLGVRTVEIGVRALVREIRTVGVVSADERRVRRIQSRVSGWVEQLFVSFTGERVRAGQPILAVYSPELFASQREFVLSLGAFEAAQDSQARASLLDAARVRLQQFGVSDAQIEALAKSRDPQRRVVLHAPSDGYVTLKSVLEGSFIEPEMELYTVSELTRVWVWAELSEDEIPLVALGQRAHIELPAAPGAREAEVAFLQPTLSSETRTLRVRFDLDNTDGALRPGMYATVRIERPLGDVLALPDEAVIDTGVRRVVFVEVEPGRFQPRTVRLGRSGESHYEVLEGLAAGERVVVSAQFLLDSESRLRGGAGPAHGAH